jgi:hypothetical protein
VRIHLVERRSIWWPTWQGWLVIVLVGGGLAVGTFRNAERFLSLTQRVPADVLVVEGWIGTSALQKAAQEFQQGRYRSLVAVGGWPGHATQTLARFAAADLIRMGCPTNRLIIGLPSDKPEDRTYESAKSARETLEKHEIRVASVMVYTEGAHARRSRLVFQKVFGPTVSVGVISYRNPGDDQKPWWNSTVRAKTVIEESCGWFMERMGFEFRE